MMTLMLTLPPCHAIADVIQSAAIRFLPHFIDDAQICLLHVVVASAVEKILAFHYYVREIYCHYEAHDY